MNFPECVQGMRGITNLHKYRRLTSGLGLFESSFDGLDSPADCCTRLPTQACYRCSSHLEP